jgi:multiple sugar transport system substrate-binding protein
MAFLWHKELCEKAGITRPPETWEELASFSKQITDYYHSKGQEDVYGYNLVMRYNHGNTMFRFMPVVWAYGGQIVNVKETGEIEVTVNSQEVIDAVKLYVRIYAKDKSCPPTAFTDTATEGIEYFLRNKVAYVIAHPSNIQYLLNNKFPVEKIGYDLYPKGPVKRASVLGGWNLHIFKDGVRSEEEYEGALILMKTLLEPEWNAKCTLGSNPGNRKAFETETWKKKYESEWWRKAPTEMLKYTVSFPPIPQWSEIGLTVLPKMLQYACSGEKTPEEAVKWAETEIKSILARGK